MDEKSEMLFVGVAFIVMGLLSVIFAKTASNLPGTILKTESDRIAWTWLGRFFGIFVIIIGLLIISTQYSQFYDFLDHLFK